MGFLDDLIMWLTNGKNSKDNIRSASIKLKVFNKRLARQVKKLEFSAKRARDKAVEFKRESCMDLAKFQAKTYLQVKNQARSVDMFRTNLENLLFKIENNRNIKDVSEVMKGVALSIAVLKKQLSIPQLTEMMSNIDLDINDFELGEEIVIEEDFEGNLDEEARKFLDLIGRKGVIGNYCPMCGSLVSFFDKICNFCGSKIPL